MPRRAGTSSAAPSRDILEAALQGLEMQRQKLDEQISSVRSMLGGAARTAPAATKRSASSSASSSSESSSEGNGRKKRVLSAAARKRIAAAQKKRWAAFRKSQ